MPYTHYLFDWGNTLMEDLPDQTGPMALWPQVKVVPGALELLRKLSQQGKCYIATNANESSAQQIRQALQRAGVDEFISGVFCYQDIGYKKPDPRYFAAVLQQLGIAKSCVVMIGDTLENDVLGALDSGIDAIWLNRYGDACPAGIKSVATLDALLLLLH